jgi:hypothetical protein
MVVGSNGQIMARPGKSPGKTEGQTEARGRSRHLSKRAWNRRFMFPKVKRNVVKVDTDAGDRGDRDARSDVSTGKKERGPVENSRLG